MNVPKIRFSEFKDEWLKEKFSQFTYYSGKRNKDNLNLVPYAITNTNGFVPQNEAHNEFGYMKDTDRKAYNIVTKNSFAYNPARINVGSIGYYSGEEDIIVSSLYEVFKTKNYINDKFIWYWLKSNKFPKWINRLQEGSVRQYFYYDKLCETPVYLPLLNEQEKIANILELLDKKIELQTKKIEDLKLFKSSQICKLISNEKCEEIELGKIGNIISGNSLGKEQISNKGVPFVLYGDLYTKYGEVIDDVKQYINDDSRLIKSEIGDLLFPTSTTVDAISLISPSRININGVVYGGDLLIFRTDNKNVDTAFLSYQINHYKKREFSKKAQGSTIIHIYSESLLNSKVKLPDINIQNKISDFGNCINKKIELENKYLIKLQDLKKGLMQNMFV